MIFVYIYKYKIYISRKCLYIFIYRIFIYRIFIYIYMNIYVYRIFI